MIPKLLSKNFYLFFLFQYIRMRMKTQNRIALKRNIKNLMTVLLPMAKELVSNKINQIKSDITQKILPNRFKKRQNTPKRVSNRGIKSLENNCRVIASKNIINTPKIAINKPQIIVEPNVVTSSIIGTKPKIATKPKKVSKLEIVIGKNTRIMMNIKIM